MISSNNSNALLKIIEGNLSKNEVFEEEQLIQLIILHNIPGRILSCIEKYNLGTMNEQIQNIAQKKDTLCRMMYN